MLIYDAETISELSTFESKGISYQASRGNHDDLVMNLVLFSWFVSSDAFGNISSIDLKEMLFKERMEQIEDDVPPFGIIDDGKGPQTWQEEMVANLKQWNE